MIKDRYSNCIRLGYLNPYVSDLIKILIHCVQNLTLHNPYDKILKHMPNLSSPDCANFSIQYSR